MTATGAPLAKRKTFQKCPNLASERRPLLQFEKFSQIVV
jgi:hypothetical protein